MRRSLALLVALALLAGCGGGGGGGGGGDSKKRSPIAHADHAPTGGPVPLLVSFDARASYDPDGEIVEMRWDFGDGATAVGDEVTHTYTAPGDHTVTLTVEDDDGRTGTHRVVVSATSTTATPPGQPLSGPGGSDYAHADVVENDYGSGDTQVWVFEPASPAPSSAPVVVFHHGWSNMTPGPYRAWIEHLVKRGNIVVYPRYQESLLTLPSRFTANAIAGIRIALAELTTPGHVSPDLDRVAMIGHSMGGVISANVAALAASESLPVFRAVLCAAPGTGGFAIHADYSRVPAGTLLLCVALEDDLIVGETDARRIFYETVAVSEDDKDYILIGRDAHGSPALAAGHSAPDAGTGFPPDAYDWYGFWKWLDALTTAAFYDVDREYALGDTPEQRDMGEWSDATPVKEPLVTDSP